MPCPKKIWCVCSFQHIFLLKIITIFEVTIFAYNQILVFVVMTILFERFIFCFFQSQKYWLVVSYIFYFPFHIWDVILPIDELIVFPDGYCTTNQNTLELIEHMLHSRVALIIGLCWMQVGLGHWGQQRMVSPTWPGTTNEWGLTKNQENNLPQMRHGAGIFIYIETPTMAQLCRFLYTSTMVRIWVV